MDYLDPDKLWNIMRKKNISPTILINELGVEPRTLGKWLVGEASPRPGSLHQLARILGVAQSSLLSKEGELHATRL